MWLIFLVSFIGFHIIFRINRAFFHSIGTSEKKLSVLQLFFSTILTILFQLMSISPIQTWVLVFILILISPVLSRGMRFHREKRLPMKCLSAIDQIILILKSGNSFRNAVEQLERTESSWFRPFLAEIRKSLQYQTQIQSDSRWFCRWSCEILVIEASKIKTLEQLEAIRRQMRAEMRSKKRIQQVTSGPKFQILFMTALFLSLNAILLRNGISQDIVFYLSIAWVLFLAGIVIALIILRSIKWII